MGIRCSGRGSAANSLVAYLLGITGVDPLEHGLLFERFLNPERRGMPDIDVDVQSDRRDELIRYVERTYTERHAAMVANIITYRSRSALRDAAKALGYPLPLVNRMTRLLSHHASRAEIPAAHAELTLLINALAPEEIRARCLERLPLLLELAPRLVGLPRHLSLHNGGMVLTREPLANLLPVRISANGVRALEVDKDDVERLGLIKFDLLGLRTLGAVEEALALIAETTGERLAIDALPLDDAATFDLVRAGQTLAVFQIESPGQWHLLAQTQPQTFDDLIVQTALFRPGPLQANMVHPYVARRQQHQYHQQRQTISPAISSLPSTPPHSPNPPWTSVSFVSSVLPRFSSVPSVPSVPSASSASSVVNPRPSQRDAVQTPWRGAPADAFWTAHPVLGPILRDTEGILLFQEQILEIAHQFAGLSYADADGFRRAMSHSRTPDEMEAMRARFVGGAAAHGETEADATRVFEAISKFVGYGFCKSHAAEFARTIYQTAYLKAHYPAHYLAAFLSCQPAGFFPPHVVLEEAKLLGIPVLPVDINRSEDRFTVERVGSPAHEKWAIRIGLRQVAQVGEDLARAILWERRPPAPAAAVAVAAAVAGASRPSDRPFTSLADFCARMRTADAGLTWTAAEALVLSGAFTSLSHGLERRRQLWQLHELWPLVAPARPARATRAARSARRVAHPDDDRPAQPAQLAIAWEISPGELGDTPPLPALSRDERAALDHRLLGLSAQPHPMRLLRRELRRSGIRAIAELADVEAGHITQVAGWAISAQRPPTAKGMGFLVLEDETGRLPVALPPRLAAQLHRILRDARVVAVCGRVERVRWYRSLLALDLRAVG